MIELFEIRNKYTSFELTESIPDQIGTPLIISTTTQAILFILNMYNISSVFDFKGYEVYYSVYNPTLE